MKILVIIYGALGDMLVATPALRALREQFPDAEITFVSNALMPQIAPEGTLANRIIACSKGELDHFFSTWKLGRQLSAQHFDMAVNLRSTSHRSALLTWLSRAPIRVGAGPRSVMWCYTAKVPALPAYHHETFRARDVMQGAGVTVSDMRPYLHVLAAHEMFADTYFGEDQFQGEEHTLTVAMHPGASNPYRAWRPERFAEIGRRLVRDHHARIIVTWAAHERIIAETVVRNIGDGAHLAPVTPTVAHLDALFMRCDVVICNNSGAMHVACAADTPVIALTGATELEKWAPLGDNHRSVKSPLGGLPPSPESERTIMDALDIESVWEAVDMRVRELRH